LAWLRRWSWTAAAAVIGLYFWFAAAIAVDELRNALAFLSTASLGGVILALRQPLKTEAPAALGWRRTAETGPTVILCISSVFMLWAWGAVAGNAQQIIIGPAVISVFHIALAAFAARARLTAPAAFAVAVGALVAGVVIYLTARAPLLPGPEVYPSL